MAGACSRSTSLPVRDVPLAKNPSTGTAQQRLFLVLKVVLHAVVVISEVLRLSTKTRCSRCCRHISTAGPSPAFPLGPVFFFSSIFTVGSLRLFLVCFAAISCRVSELAPPRRFSPAFASKQLLLQLEIIVDVHTILSLLLSLCLQPAATDCSSYCKWRAAVLGRAISKFSNRNV